MKYNSRAKGGGIEAQFEGILEVETISRAFKENADRLCALGNDSSVSEYQKRVARWTGSNQTYRGPSLDLLVEPIQYFVESTEDRVDELLDTCQTDVRIEEAGRRYELGREASRLLAEIDSEPNDNFQVA